MGLRFNIHSQHHSLHMQIHNNNSFSRHVTGNSAVLCVGRC